nr:vesicle transport through interaction with [Hymenolepis microstoma]
MASILESYEKQYGNLTSEITSKLNNISRLANEERKAEIAATTRLFDETRELLEQMDLEIQDMPAEVKPKYTTRLQCYGQELARLAQEFKRPRYSANAAPTSGPLSEHNTLREELLSGTGGDSSDMRVSLLSNTERVERTGRRLNDGLRVAYETEEIGGRILGDLDQQRETIMRSRDRLRHANEDLSRSSRIISKMYRRVIQNRAVLAAIGILMILVFFGIIYMIFFRSSGTQPNPPIIAPSPQEVIKHAETTSKNSSAVKSP